MLLFNMYVTKPTVEIAKRVRGYLADTLGIEAAVAPSRIGEHLPQVLRAYGFAELEILGTRCLLMLDRRRAEQPAAVIRKHMEMLAGKWTGPMIYARERVDAYSRRRLIEQKIPFIVPGNQMYLPMIGLDLRERFRPPRPEPTTLSPASQAVVLYVLLRAGEDTFSPGALAGRLGYSAMTLTRAFDEIEALCLGEAAAAGRERRLCFNRDKRALWTQAEPLMRSPVLARRFVRPLELGKVALPAGLSALSECSSLAPPEHPVLALGREEWKSLRRRNTVVDLPDAEPPVLELEVWSYRPALLAENNRVDVLSLYLSLRDSGDERVQSALSEATGMLPW